VKISRLIALSIIPLLFACFPKKPEIPMTEAPPGPLIKALERHMESFSSLKALAEMQVVRKDRRRSFENVAVLVEGQKRFRIEAYGPLGANLATLLWDGKQLLMDLAGERRVISPGNPLMERVLGADVDPSELCAILSGGIPGTVSAYDARMFCAIDGSCVLDLRSDETMVRVQEAAGWESRPFVIPSWEMFRNGKFLYRVCYEFSDKGGGRPIPRQIRIENPDRRVSLIIRYIDSESNVRIDERAFMISGMEEPEQ
jgi:hypothetical protein